VPVQSAPDISPDVLLRERFGESLQTSLPLSAVTSMAIGGPVRFFLQAHAEADLVAAVRIARTCHLDWCVMGDGSNIVASDTGYEGLIVQNRIHAFAALETSLTVGAGDHLGEVVLQADRLGLRGLEKMAGIPGTVGGAVYGCAGAYGQEMRDHICEVRFFNAGTDRFETLSAEECRFGYRDSIFKRHKDWIISQVVLDLQAGDPEQLLKVSQDLISQRQRKFALDLKCPGCYFKNIRLDYIDEPHRQAFLSKIDPAQVTYGKVAAGYLLEVIGAKSTRVGGVEVSRHHGNLIVNTSGNAKACDLLALVAQLKQRVHSRFGVELQEEVQYLGF
jgi:UDP-N-acetylmuramate dehydrogenase